MPDADKSLGMTPQTETPRPPRSPLVQLHLWTRPEDLVYLRQVAAERDQTVSAVVRSMVRAYQRARASQAGETPKRDERTACAVPARYIRP